MQYLPDGTPDQLAEWGRQVADHDPRPGVSLRSDGLPDIVWGEVVPAGTYLYQSSTHTMTYPYKLARYPLTVVQFQVFINSDDGTVNDQWWVDLPSKFGKDAVSPPVNPLANHPRDKVSFHQAIAYTRWLTSKYHAIGLLEANWEIRMPADFEWEIAARYPDGRLYPWGDDYRVGHANVDEKADGVGVYSLGTSTAVGLYEAGRHPQLNLYDLTGNVWEWCFRYFPDSDQPLDNDDPLYKIRGRVRGGSWCHNHTVAQSTIRDFYEADPRFDCYGLRLCTAPVNSLEAYQ